MFHLEEVRIQAVTSAHVVVVDLDIDPLAAIAAPPIVVVNVVVIVIAVLASPTTVLAATPTNHIDMASGAIQRPIKGYSLSQPLQQQLRIECDVAVEGKGVR